MRRELLRKIVSGGAAPAVLQPPAAKAVGEIGEARQQPASAGDDRHALRAGGAASLREDAHGQRLLQALGLGHLADAVAIAAPDDALIRALLVKLFVDRQLIVDTALVEYLATRLERSFAAARAAVERLDRETLARRRRLTRQAAAEILGWT